MRSAEFTRSLYVLISTGKKLKQNSENKANKKASNDAFFFGKESKASFKSSGILCIRNFLNFDAAVGNTLELM